MVGRPYHSFVGVTGYGSVPPIWIIHHEGAGQDADTAATVTSARDAVDSYAVVVDSCDNTCHMGTVVVCGDNIALITCDEAFTAVRACRDADCCQVGVVELHTAVQHCNDDVRGSCHVIVPHRNYIDVTVGQEETPLRTVIIERPLPGCGRVVEKGGRADTAFRFGVYYSRHFGEICGSLRGRSGRRIDGKSVPSVQACTAMSWFPFPGIRVEAFHLDCAEALQLISELSSLGIGRC